MNNINNQSFGSTQDEKGVVQIFVVIILIVALVLTVVVVTNPDIKSFIFKSRASNANIVIKDSNGNPLPTEGDLPVTTSRTVKVELEAPPAP